MEISYKVYRGTKKRGRKNLFKLWNVVGNDEQNKSLSFY